MTASRSRFYVDTPPPTARDPSSRHSMFASQSELDRTARPSPTASCSSSTLPPIISGSVDRLTSLGGGGDDKKKNKKKKHRFSFGNLSGSTLSLKPLFGSGRRKSVDSASQTDAVEVGVTTVGVQTQNAPTVDVPVQTSFVAWDGRRAFNGAAPTPRSGKGSLPPVAVCELKTSEKVPKQSGSPSTRVTLVTSGEPQPGLQSSGSVLSVYEVPTGEPSGQTATSPSFLPAGEPRSSPAVESKSDEVKGALPSGGVATGSGDLVSGSPRLSPRWGSSKSSAPDKAELPERCPSRNKTVQFDLPDYLDCHEEPAKPVSEKKRNVDEEFEALLRDLDIITDSPDDINFSYRNIQQHILPPIQIKPAFDVFRPEYLAPIPENNEPHDAIENPHYQHIEIPSSKNPLNHIDNFTEIKNPSRHIETDNPPSESIEPDSRRLYRPKPVDRNSVREISADSVKTLPPLAPTKLDISVIYPTEHSAYIYEPGIKQEEEEEDDSTKQPPEKTVAMPTLPSFFETCGSADDASSTDAGRCQDDDVPHHQQQQQNGDRRPSLESECDIKLRFSRSNSCNSTRSSTLSGFDALCDSSLRFDSCENLERLEDEIIRSLCTPVRELEEEMSGAHSDGATDVNVNREASNRRRAILDKLLGGVSAEEPVFSHDSYGEKSGKFPVGTPQKYTATLTKIEHVTDEEPTVGNHFDPNDCDLDNNSEPQVPSYNSSLVPVPAECPAHVETLSPKKTSLFLFPDVNSQTSEVSSVEVQVPSNVPSRLEVRRSSWSVPSLEPRKSPVRNAPTHLGDVTENKPVTEDETRGRCEYTNCVKPSQMQNGPFTASGPFADLGSRPLTPRGSVGAATPSRNDSPCGSKAQNESTAERCDYASCLKPSQVHNSLFTAELSELRSSSQPPKRPLSPLPVTASGMSTANANHANEWPKAKKEEDAAEPEIKVTSELQITLKSPSEKALMDNRPRDAQSTSRLPTPPPPPPPPPPKNYVPQRSPSLEPADRQSRQKDVDGDSMGAMIRAQHSKLVTREVGGNKPVAPPKSPMMVELERRFESRQRSVERQGEDDSRGGEEEGGPEGVVGTEIEANDDKVDYRLNSDTGTNRVWQNISPVNNTNKLQNGNSAMPSDQQEHWSKSPENVYHTSYQNGINGQRNMQFAPTTIITDEPPPPGAVLVDKKVTVDGDKIHTDKYYAMPVKEVLKETTSTTKFIPAPPKYEGIGPTEEGIPTGLRHSVKKENYHNWYKTMYKSLHKADENLDDTQEYIIGYTSEPETRKDIMIRKKSATLDFRQRNEIRSNNVHLTQDYPPSAKSTIDVYNVHPRLIEDYEPGQSSVTDNCITYGSKRFLPAMNVPKPSYEFKKGYESDTTLTKKSPQPESLDEEQQKAWYRQIQRGGDVPQFGLGKVVPERPKDPVIGPPPPPPMNYQPRQPTYQEATRPATLPSEYTNQNGNSLFQQPNGIYETQIRQALHSEMQRRMSPSSQQLSPPNRSMSKSPSKSPEMRTPSRALFNFNAESPKELPLKKGEMVLILRQLDKNWYEGEKKGTVGIFPINYVEIVPPEHITFTTKSSVEGLGKALYDFKAQTPVEISVRKGDTVAVIRRVDVNWYEGRIANKKGIIPVSYIQVLQQPYESKTSSPSPKAFTDSRSRSASKERTHNTSNASPVYNTHSPNSDYVSDKRNKFQNRSKKGNSLIEPVLYRAVYSYSPQNSDELELLEGDTIYVVEMCDDGWYVGTSVRTGVFGIFPGNYLEKV